MGACAAILSSEYAFRRAEDGEQPLLHSTAVSLTLTKGAAPKDVPLSTLSFTSKRDLLAEKRRSMASTSMNEFFVCSSYQWLLKAGSVPFVEAANMTTIRVLELGNVATIRLARWTTNYRKLFCAIKEIQKARIPDATTQQRLINERDALSKFTSPFIVQMFGTFQTDTSIFMMLQYIPGGGLSQLMVEQAELKPQEALFVATEVLLAIEHIHQNGMVFRNLLPESVMIDETGHIKLVGFHYVTTPPKSGMCNTICGLPAYHAPEQLNPQYLGGYSKCVDFWAFACLLFEMMCARPPFCSAAERNSGAINLLIQKHQVSGEL